MYIYTCAVALLILFSGDCAQRGNPDSEDGPGEAGESELCLPGLEGPHPRASGCV